MSLTSVKMSEEVWLTCMTHALTTETEEIMGLLLGDIQHSKDGGVTALIWGASPQLRSDRRKDRVETNPELLAAASAQAEKMTAATGKTTRVIGWYHSHPHITVLPSHVGVSLFDGKRATVDDAFIISFADVRTQAMYQLLDPGFVGLIFSCYSEDAQKVGRIQVIAFQSCDGRQRPVGPSTNNSIIYVETSLSTSDNILSASVSSINDNPVEDTGDSRAINAAEVGRKSSDYESTSHDDVNYKADRDSMDMTDGMQEALHRSNLEISSAEYQRKEVPLQVLSSSLLLKLDAPLKSFTDLQHVLFEEERSAYNQAMANSLCNGKIHPLSFIHHTSTYQASMCKLMEYCLAPALNTLENRIKENEMQLAFLTEEAKMLENEISKRDSLVRGQRSSSGRGHKDVVASPSSPNVRNKVSSVSRAMNSP